MLRLALTLSAVVALSGCVIAGQVYAPVPAQSKDERAAQVASAAQAVKLGNYEHAERLMADYMYRDQGGELLFKSTSFTSASRKQAVDTVAQLLWETGRNESLEHFASRYLSGYERSSMLCRVAERGAVYEKAYNCWNELGDIDRARRVIKTESALRILKD